jgi:hypothetical protein
MCVSRLDKKRVLGIYELICMIPLLLKEIKLRKLSILLISKDFFTCVKKNNTFALNGIR